MIVAVDESNILQAAAVHAASWRASHRLFCSPEFVAAHTVEHQQDYLREKIQNGSRFYLLVEGVPAGVVSVTGSSIEDLYVIPEMQGRGIGTQLLEFAIGQCEGTPMLWILENNDRAGRLYRRLGFRETGRAARVDDGLDEIELALV